MKLSSFLKDLSIERNDYFYLSLLLVYSVIITALLINFNKDLGVYCSDVFIYLYNSLVFAKIAFFSKYLYLSPFICLLTSLLFRLGYVSEVSIFIVTGIFSIFSSIGIYALLRRYFNSIVSLTGAVLFTSFSLNLLWWANGTLDVPAVALSIWAVLFFILALDENPRYFLLAFPLLVLGIFTRYTCLFLLPLFLLYYLSRHDFFYHLDLLIWDRKQFFSNLKQYLKSRELKYIILGLVLSLAILAIFAGIIMSSGSQLTFLTQGSSLASGSKGAVNDSAYTTDTFFYLHDFLNFLFSQKVVFDGIIPNMLGASYLSYLVLAILVIGLLIAAYRLFNKSDNSSISGNSKSRNDLKNNKDLMFKTKHFDLFLKCLFILSLIIAILGFKVNSLITITFLLVDLVIAFSLLKAKGLDRESYAPPIFMFVWFAVYFIFFTFFNIKVNRYIITVFPAFVYFVSLALNEILNSLDGLESLKINRFNLSNLIPIALIILCLFSAFSFTGTIEHDMDFNDCKVVADYLIQYDDDYASKDVAVSKQRQFSWFLRGYTIAVTTEQTDFLESSNITYYICDEDMEIKNYKKIYNYKDIFLYERVN